ncbi:MAG: mechanosensitive ion channel family protein [Chloroflexota bacterium]
MIPFDLELQDLVAQFLTFLPRLIAALVIFVVTLFLAGLIAKAVRRALMLRKSGHHADDLITKIAQVSILVFGTVIALQQIGFNVSAFLAGVGIIGFTVGFALQDVSKNFVAGLLLYIQQPFGVGDAIKVTGFAGIVQKINLRATEMRTFDGTLVLIPNADVFSNPITNYSALPTRRIELIVGVAYDSDLEEVSRVVLETVRSIPGVLDDPVPEVIFTHFGASSIDFALYFWTQLDQLGLFVAKSTAIMRIKTAFEQAGIDIPYPVTSVKLVPGENGQGRPPSQNAL